MSVTNEALYSTNAIFGTAFHLLDLHSWGYMRVPARKQFSGCESVRRDLVLDLILFFVENTDSHSRIVTGFYLVCRHCQKCKTSFRQPGTCHDANPCITCMTLSLFTVTLISNNI
ncbi:hypothetical protein BsWGS_11654 [Bradybaena similaris]